MKRNRLIKVAALILSLMLAIFGAMPVLADDGSVDFDGKDFSYSPESTDLFGSFKGVMPGDSLVQPVKLTNHADNDATFYLKMKIAKQEEMTPEELELVHNLLFDTSLLRITVKSGGEVVYADMAGGTDKRSFEEEGAYTSASIELGKLPAKGGSQNLEIILDASASIGNEYMDLIAHVDWELMADVVEPEPKTGDDTNIYFYIGLMAAGMLAIVCLLITRIRKNDNICTDIAGK